MSVTSNIRLQKTDFHLACIFSGSPGFLTLRCCVVLAGVAHVTESDHGTESGLWPITTEELHSTNSYMSVNLEVIPATAEPCDGCSHCQHFDCLIVFL